VLSLLLLLPPPPLMLPPLPLLLPPPPPLLLLLPLPPSRPAWPDHGPAAAWFRAIYAPHSLPRRLSSESRPGPARFQTQISIRAQHRVRLRPRRRLPRVAP
jgi:hypothetical protein